MDNCVSTTENLLRKIKVIHSKSFLEDTILSHPDHPSLLCITDTLEKYQIENLAVKIEAEKLLEMPLPCIVQIIEDHEDYLVVLNSISRNEVSYFDEKNKLIKMSFKKFNDKWSGVCLLAEKSTESKEPGIEERLSKKYIFIILKVAVLAFFSSWIIFTFISNENIVHASFAISTSIYAVLKMIGLAVGALLLWFEVDEYNPTLQSFCSGGGKINCNAVLNSKQAQILNGNLSISLVVFAYFFGSLFTLIASGFDTSTLSMLGYLSFLSAPAIVVSFYYQAFVIKQWCKFCMMVQIVILSEIVTVYFGAFSKTDISAQYIFLFSALFFTSILGWKVIKPLLKKERETNLYLRGLKKIKANPEVFMGLLSKSKKISTSTKNLGIVIRNENAKYDIIKVCNPYCGPCANAHPILEGLVQKGIINLRIVFATNIEDTHSSTPVRHLLAIDSFGDSEKTRTALDDWYNEPIKDYTAFSKKFPMNGEMEKQYDKISAMQTWCKAEKIKHTPTVFINSHELPPEYEIEDLKDLLI